MTDATATTSEQTATFAPKQKLMIETTRQVSVARFAPDGQTIVGAGYDGLLHRWSLAGEEPTEQEPLAGHGGWVTAIAFATAGTEQPSIMLSVDSWGRLSARRVDALEDDCLWNHADAHDGWIRGLAVSADGRQAITAGRDRCLRIWNVSDGKLLRLIESQPDELHCVAIHPDGSEFVSSDLRSRLRRWNMSTGELLDEKPFDDMHLYERIQDVTGLRVLQFTPDGNHLLLGGALPSRTAQMQGTPIVSELKWPTLESVRSWKLGAESNGYVFDIARHDSGMLAIVTSGTPGNGQLLLLNPMDEKPFHTETKMSNCHSVSWHPQRSELLVSATNRNSQGNGPVTDKEGNYLGNSSPLHLYNLQDES